jgi:hypothetical protein
VLGAREKSRSKSASGGGWLRRAMPNGPSLRGILRWSLRLGFATLFVLAVLGSIHVKDRVQADSRFSLETWRLEPGTMPEWVTPEIELELRSLRLAGVDDRLSLFSPGVLERVRKALESSPWIESVPDIDIRYPTFEQPGVLALELRLRRPVALVEQGGLYYLTDAEGVRIGSPYREAPTDWFGVPAITGVPPPGCAVPVEGARWPSRDVLQGVEVAKVLFESQVRRDFPGQPVDAIDLTNLHGRVAPRESEIMLWCGRQRFAWGRSPISAGPRTATVDQLISNLRLVLANPDAYSHLAVIHLHRRPEALTGVRG